MSHRLFSSIAVLVTCVTSLAVSVGSAATLGEISADPSEGVYQFYKGDIDLQVGERLTGKGEGTGIYFFEVLRVEGDQAWAKYEGQRLTWGYLLRSPQKGDRVRLIIPRQDQLFMDFFAGVSNGKEEHGYSGKGGAFAFTVGGYFSELWSWDIRLGADQWGKEPTVGIRKQRSYYLFGVGYNPGGLRLKGFYGLLDHVTILDSAQPSGYTDPYTGKLITNEGPTMDPKWGYSISLGYQFDMKSITRNRLWGWYLLPQYNYSNTLVSSNYPASSSIGLAVGLTSTPF